MGVFKEEAHIFENIAKKQKRIYNDAADFGYPYNTKSIPQEVKNVFETISSLTKIDKEYPDETPFIRNRQQWKDGVSVDVIIFWEQDEGYYRGTKYTISFNRTPKHPSLIDQSSNAFISVDVSPYSEKV